MRKKKKKRWSRGHKSKDTKKSEAKAKNTLSRPRTGMLGQGHKHKCSPKKKVSKKFFQAISKKKVFKNFFQAFFSKQTSSKTFFQAIYKSSTTQKKVLSSSGGQGNFRGLEAKHLIFKVKDFKMCP